MSDATENWKDVPGFEGRYRVSDLGRVYSLVSGRCLRPGRMSGGHMSVALGRNNTRCVHELVLTTFVGPRPLKHDSRHLNGQHTDNRLDNLQWSTRARNIQDKKWHGQGRKLTGQQAAEIKRRLAEGETQRTLARDFGVSRSLVSNIAVGGVHADA